MNLRKLTMAGVLVTVLAFTAFGDCPDAIPGETHTPPCSAALITPDDPFAPGETNTPPAATTYDVVTISETAMSFLLSALPLF
jgi:hypothetical protein